MTGKASALMKTDIQRTEKKQRSASICALHVMNTLVLVISRLTDIGSIRRKPDMEVIVHILSMLFMMCTFVRNAIHSNAVDFLFMDIMIIPTIVILNGYILRRNKSQN